MARYVRNTAVLLKLETTYGTDPTPAGGTDALLVSNLGYPSFNANNVDRDNVRPYFGASEQLVGTKYSQVSFDVELQGSGAAGTAPAWGPALQACAFAETVVTDTYVSYAPVTDSQESATIYWYDSGVLHKLTGARGTARLNLQVGERPVITFTFTGIYNTLTAASLPSVTLTGWKTPAVVTDTNTVDVTLGATLTDGALSGGTAYVSTGLEIDVGNAVEFIPLIGRESVDITDRQATLRTMLELSAAQEVSAMADVIANTTGAVSIQHGSSAGSIVIAHMPTVQRINPTKEDRNGLRLIGFDGRLVPTTAGNDELTIIAA